MISAGERSARPLAHSCVAGRVRWAKLGRVAAIAVAGIAAPRALLGGDRPRPVPADVGLPPAPIPAPQAPTRRAEPTPRPPRATRRKRTRPDRHLPSPDRRRPGRHPRAQRGARHDARPGGGRLRGRAAVTAAAPATVDTPPPANPPPPPGEFSFER